MTRLVHQKGIHLIKHAAWRTLERGGQFVLLGSAPDGRVQGEFNALRDQLTRQYPDRCVLPFCWALPRLCGRAQPRLASRAPPGCHALALATCSSSTCARMSLV